MGALVLNIYRARAQSLTVDEAFSYNNFIAPPFREAFAHYDANNHVLNTLLAKPLVRIFGASEIVLRLPSLLGGALYLCMVTLLSTWMFGSGFLAILSFVLLAGNPIVLDYLSAARGYSLALGFQFLAVMLMARSGRERIRNVMIGVALALSSAGNLVFAIPNLVLVAVFLVLLASQTPRLRPIALATAQIALPGLAVFGALMYVPLAHASRSNFYIGEASLARSAEILLVRSLNYPSLRWAEQFSGPIGKATGPAILLSIALWLVLSVTRGNPRPAALIFPVAFLGSLGILVALHRLIAMPYPYERTGLYFIPLISLAMLGAADAGFRWKALRIPAAMLGVYLCCVAAQYLLELKVNRYEEWASDAGTKRVITVLASMHRSPGQKRLGISWEFEPSVNYYRERLHLDWLEPVTRAAPLTGGFDYYYLTPNDQRIAETLKLTVLYADPVSKSILAAPSSNAMTKP